MDVYSAVFPIKLQMRIHIFDPTILVKVNKDGKEYLTVSYRTETDRERVSAQVICCLGRQFGRVGSDCYPLNGQTWQGG